jgi:hypothetical protein
MVLASSLDGKWLSASPPTGIIAVTNGRSPSSSMRRSGAVPSSNPRAAAKQEAFLSCVSDRSGESPELPLPCGAAWGGK